jgi:dTDP-4-dehydrorhamnose reductase
LLSTNILNKDDVDEIIKIYKPDEIYYLAAYHHSSEEVINDENELFQKSKDIHVN